MSASGDAGEPKSNSRAIECGCCGAALTMVLTVADPQSPRSTWSCPVCHVSHSSELGGQVLEVTTRPVVVGEGHGVLPTLDALLNMYRALTGREPTGEEIEETRRTLGEQDDEDVGGE